MTVDTSTYEFLLAEYGEDGALVAIAEIEYWQDNGRLPKWAVCLQEIIAETDGSLTFVHRDRKANDSGKGGA